MTRATKLFDAVIWKLLRMRYKIDNDTSLRDALNHIENSKWLEDRGYYRIVSTDFYCRTYRISVESKCLLMSPTEIQMAVVTKEEEAKAAHRLKRYRH